MSYGYPKAVEAVNVPISFWTFPLDDSQIKFQTSYVPDNVPTEIMEGHMPLPNDCGYQLDSVFTYHKGHFPSKESRCHFIYENDGHKGSTIQLLHMHKGSPAASAFPPIPDMTQKFKVAQEKIGDVDCYYAYRSEKYGPHELIFQARDYQYLMLVKPASWTSREWFFNLLENFFLR